MATIDEVVRLQREGKSDAEIIKELKRKGIPERDIIEAISQSKIKEAVSSDGSGEGEEEYGGVEPPLPNGGGVVQEMGAPAQGAAPNYDPAFQQQFSDPSGENGDYYAMQPSVMGGPQQVGGAQEYGSAGGAQDYQEAAGSAYQFYQGGMSSDVVSEIAEQVVSEKLFAVQDKLEKVIDMKTSFDARISHMDERLKRMERMIDTLQISLLQKMGEYMSNVSDVKKELEETQKSFGALHRTHHSHEGHHTAHHGHSGRKHKK